MVLMVAAARRCATMLSAPGGFGAFWGPGLRRFCLSDGWRRGGCLGLAVRRFCASRAAFLERAGKEAPPSGPHATAWRRGGLARSALRRRRSLADASARRPTRYSVYRARPLICEVEGTLGFSEDSRPVIDILRTARGVFAP